VTAKQVPGDSADYRLPRSAQPRHYRLELTPDLAASRFEGEEVVTLDLEEPVDALVCNAVELEIQGARLETPAGANLDGRVELDEAAQRATIAFDSTLPAGSGYRLQLRFTGVLNDQLHGFYRSTFTDDEGGEHVIAVTQFEPADARRAFPCWDEPEFKAVFAVTLVVDDRLTALANASVASEEPAGDGRRRVRFHETMLMSTYLVAFVVGPFELTPPVEVDGVPLRVAAVPGKSHLTGFAVEVGTHALRFLSRYFELPYPADKIDHIAIPDFAFGAMENLGCVTYRENALLVDPPEASQLELQRVGTVVAHETAHMWFGDLVTMKWWNGIWLNEAFATFMELAVNEHYRPDWRVWVGFGSGKAAALATDGLRSTRPVEFAVGRPEEAEAMFDVLTYQKGGAVLRMLEQYIGPETFRKGISHYLSIHAHANTETGDLWDAIEAVSGEPVRTIMDSWIFQGGYPLISVEADGQRGTLRLSQRRFVYGDPAPDPVGDGGERWAVPVNLRASVGGVVQRQRLLVDGATASIDLDGPLDWVVVNDGGWGFYRVHYDHDLLSGLLKAGLATVCDPLERMALVLDYWAGVVSGAIPLDQWVGAVEALGDEEDPDVWAAVGSALRLLDLIAADGDDRAALHSFVRRIAGRSWTRLGWDPAPGEDQRTGITRGRVLSILGLLGDEASLGEAAVARFREFLAGRSGLAPDLLTPIAHVVAAWGGEEDWTSILERYRSGTTPQDKVRYLTALPATRDPALLARTLDLVLGDEVRTQDGYILMAEVMANRAGDALAWEWLERHWDEVQDRFPPALLARSLEGIATLVNPAVADAVHAFADSHELPMAGPRLDQLLERMDINLALAARLEGTMAAALHR
jgi:puromycin-sensitive aminopeptidase